MQKVGFVSPCDSHFGQTLCKILYNDDFDIRGVTNKQTETAPNYVKHHFIKEDRDAVKKHLLESDVIVIHLEDQTDLAMRCIKLLNTTLMNVEKTAILISSVQTWAETKRPAPEDDEPADDDGGEENVEEEEEVDPWTEEQAAQRTPNLKYKEWKEVELLWKKSNSPTLHTYVVWSGVQYGLGEDRLHSIFQQAWRLSPKGLPMYGNGKQFIPMIHVQDLATFTWKLGISEEPLDQRYYFGVDQGIQTWRQIMEGVNLSLGQQQPTFYQIEEAEFGLTPDVEHFTTSIKVQGDAIQNVLAEEDWVAQSGFLENIQLVVKEYRTFRKIQPLHLTLLGPPNCGKSHISKLLSEHYKVPTVSILDVIREFEQLKVDIDKQISDYKQAKRDAKRRAKEEEKERKRRERGGGDDEDEDELGDDAAEQDDEDPDRDLETPDDENQDGDDEDEEDEFLEKSNEKLKWVKQVLSMKVKQKKPEADEEKEEEEAEDDETPAVNKRKGKRKGIGGMWEFLKVPEKEEQKQARLKAEQAKKEAEQNVPQRYTDKSLTIMLRWKFAQPGCLNQGLILDGYPKTVKQARLLYQESELEPPAEGEEEEEDDEELTAAVDMTTEEGTAAKVVDEKYLPEHIISLNASDKFLTERLMHMMAAGLIAPSASAQAMSGAMPSAGDNTDNVQPEKDHRNPTDYLRRLEFYKNNFLGAKGLKQYLAGIVTNIEEAPREARLKDVPVDQCPTLPPPPLNILEEPIPDVAFKAITDIVGAARNFGATAPELELKQQRIDHKLEKERQAADVDAAHKLKLAEEHNVAMEKLKKQESLRLAHVKAQARLLKDMRGQPLKKYLMDNILPVLTKGLIEVCEVRPEDPIDYLADWLFRAPPEVDDL